MNTHIKSLATSGIAGYSLSASLLVLAIVYGQSLFTAVSIAQPALFQG